MKLKMYFVMLAMGLMSFAFQSCSDDDEAPISVPTELENAFVNEFGDVAHSWTTSRSGHHVAKFQENNQQKEAWFDANGAWMMTETDVPFEALPQAVKDGFALLTDYADWKIDDVDMLQRQGMEDVYVIEVEKGNQEVDLYFDVNGNLLKEVVDVEDDPEQCLPTALPEAVKAYLDQHFAGYKMLEFDIEKKDPEMMNFVEVDIVFNGKQLEVLFNDKAEWAATSEEVLFSTLPQAVQEAAAKLIEKYPGTELDDEEAVLVLTPAGKFYVVELEVIDESKPDIEVMLNEKGEVVE